MKPYTELLESVLVMEYNKTPERAKELVKNNPNIVTQGIMHGNQSLRASAMLLDDIDSKAPDASAPNVSDQRPGDRDATKNKSSGIAGFAASDGKTTWPKNHTVQ